MILGLNIKSNTPYGSTENRFVIGGVVIHLIFIEFISRGVVPPETAVGNGMDNGGIMFINSP